MAHSRFCYDCRKNGFLNWLCQCGQKMKNNCSKKFQVDVSILQFSDNFEMMKDVFEKIKSVSFER